MSNCLLFLVFTCAIPTSDNAYTFYTDGSLSGLDSSSVSIGWSWIQLLASCSNGIAAFDHGHISFWPSSSHAEIAAVYSALSQVPFSASVTLHVNSFVVIAGLASCVSSSQFVDSCLYYRHSNFEMWFAVAFLISSKNLTLTCIKVKLHSGNYFNDHVDFLADTAHSHLDLVCLDSLPFPLISLRLCSMVW